MDDIDDILDKLEEDEINQEYRDANVQSVDRLELFPPFIQENHSNGISEDGKNGDGQWEASDRSINGDLRPRPISLNSPVSGDPSQVVDHPIPAPLLQQDFSESAKIETVILENISSVCLFPPEDELLDPDTPHFSLSASEIKEQLTFSTTQPDAVYILPSENNKVHSVPGVDGSSTDVEVAEIGKFSGISSEKSLIQAPVDTVPEENSVGPSDPYTEEIEDFVSGLAPEDFQIPLLVETVAEDILPLEEASSSLNLSANASSPISIPTVSFQPASWGAVDDVSDSELEQFLSSLGETEGTSLSAELQLLPSEKVDQAASLGEFEVNHAHSELRMSPPLEMAPPIPMTLVDVTEFMDQEGPSLRTDSRSSDQLVNISEEDSEAASTSDETLIEISTNSSQDTEPSPSDYLIAVEETPSAEENGSFRSVAPSFVANENAAPPPTVIFSADNLGKVRPEWVPDEFAPICMLCGARFNMVKRRHHCRACGSVICASCGNFKAKLDYLEMREDRICALCNETFQYRNGGDQNQGQRGDAEEDAENLRSPSPVVVASFNGPQPPGVLRRQDQPRRERRNVVFFDGIRPGGDLMEPEFHGNGRRLAIMNAKRQRRSPGGPQEAPPPPKSRGIPKKSSANHVVKLFVNRDLLPVMEMTKDGHFVLHETPDLPGLLEKFAVCPSEAVDFYVNLCLRVTVQVVDLQCCMNVTVWSYLTSGMRLVGQDEIVILLVKQDEDSLPPRDVFVHLNEIFLHAKQGHVIGNLGHSIVALGGYDLGFLGNRNNAGFLLIRQSYQCVSSLKLPEQPYLFGILMTKWEVPWAKMFPLRLMLRLGTEYRYYPCPLISFRNRKPVFEEVGHTVMNLLCDFRNFQYHLPCVEDTECCMEKGVITARFPRHRYDQIVKVCQGSNEHVLAIGLGFSKRADAHLVCVQNLENGQYETQAINIQSKGRKVTGTSFIIFNASLKGTETLECRAAVVEDGIMAQINLRGLEELKTALKSMRNITFKATPKTDDVLPVEQETIVIEWTNDSKTCNAGVRSPIDGKDMTGIESRRVSLKHSMDFLNGTLAVRCTEVFLSDEKDSGMVYREEIDVSRLAENLAMASCSVLRSHLYDYRDGGATKIALRVSLGPDTVEYEVGAKGERFPPQVLAEFDEKIMPLIYECARVWGVRPRLELELIFRVFQH